ncbi:Uncharacterized protein Adt_39259 [Abeliophyllum distichum]|uniref:Uncharacterized protein n=1 Tax=Abeliophyllum distichum TaxID=126358 RepID=A0ABD1Q4K6_9LAMI
MYSLRNYAKGVRLKLVENCTVHGHRPMVPSITFMEEDEVGVHYLHCDSLVVCTVVPRNGLGKMSVDDGSAVNILFGSTFDQMEVDHGLTTILEPLFRFTHDSLVLRG